MRLSTLTDYAVVMMTELARQGEGGRLSAGAIARASDIPVPTAQKVVGALTRAGLLVSARGAGGGVRLARDAEAIALADIIEAVEGPIVVTPCATAHPGACVKESRCNARSHWPAVNSAVRGTLAAVTLASLSGSVS